MQGKKGYQEKLFLSFLLSERVPQDNFYRKLKETLDISFLQKSTKQYYGTEGQKSIDTEVFFKLMLIGYLENICSDRKIIEQASMRMDMLYFLGYNIDESLPWHSTLSRTRKLFGEEVFLELFRKILVMCVDEGMVGGKTQAVDSAFIKANASMDSLAERSLIEKSSNFYKEISDNEDEPEKKIHKRGTKCSNDDYVSTTDPDARVSLKRGKISQLNYLGQVSVDTDSHVICGAMADYADKKDSESIPAIVGQTINNLEKSELKVKEVLADTNYSSGEALKYLEENDITAFIPTFGPYKPNHEGFAYNAEEDCYVCSQGIKLSFKRIKKRSDCNKYSKQYRNIQKDCQDCPLKSHCTDKRGIKSIEDTLDKPYYDRTYQRVHTCKGQKMRRLRSAVVEPVLGTLINFRGMRKVYTKGIDLANKHVLMAAMAYNLKKLMCVKALKPIAKPVWNEIDNLKAVVFNRISNFYRILLSAFFKKRTNDYVQVTLDNKLIVF